MEHLIVTAILAGRVGGDSSEAVTESADALHVSDLVMVNVPETEGLVRIANEYDTEERTIGYEGDSETFDLDDWVPMVGDEPPEDAQEVSYSYGHIPVFGQTTAEQLDDGGQFVGMALGAWLDHSGFGVVAGNVHGGDLDGFGLVIAASQGAAGPRPATGGTTWTGTMAGFDYSRSPLASVTARAELHIPDLSTPRVDITFTRRSDEGADMRWPGISVTNSRIHSGSDIGTASRIQLGEVMADE